MKLSEHAIAPRPLIRWRLGTLQKRWLGRKATIFQARSVQTRSRMPPIGKITPFFADPRTDSPRGIAANVMFNPFNGLNG